MLFREVQVTEEEETQIKTKLTITQVEDGKKYKGEMTLNDDHTLRYEIEFTVPIPELDNMDHPAGPDLEWTQRTFPITVTRKDGTVVKLTANEYGFFFSTVAPFANEFYHNSQTRDSNKGVVGMALRGEGMFSGTFGLGSASISIESTRTMLANPQLVSMLERVLGESLS